MNYNMYIFTSLFQSNQFILIVPEYKIIIYYKKVKSNDTVCIFANVGVPTTYCRMPSGIYFIKKDSSQTAAHRFLEYIGPTSCRVAHLPGNLCRQPILGRCEKHVGPMTAHCWVAEWKVK